MLFVATNILFLILMVCVLTFTISLALVMGRGAPWLPTPRSKVREMLTLAHAGADDTLIDLGAGDGIILFTAVRECGVQKAIGYELNPFFVWGIRLRTLLPRYRGRVFVYRKNLFKADLSSASIITCFLLQGTNEKLEPKLQRECKPGTRIVSRAFSFPNLTRVEKTEERTPLRLYTI
ncbi:MAG: SAM-dependent methyltransferase [bacterium]|nr:SAM-dependent methyltransferase [bacterium]